MSKFLALLALLLVAAAFFLPAELTEWGDQQLLNVPHIVAREEEREGFAESLQLPVAEKLLLLHSGDMLGMSMDTLPIEGMFTTPISGESAGRIEHRADHKDAVQETSAYFNAASGNVSYRLETAEPTEEDYALWDQRLQSLWSEIRSLQIMGGLPTLWPAGSELEYTCFNEMLYMDRTSGSAFQLYDISLGCAPYSLDLTVDSESGRIVAFTLSWSRGEQPNWDSQGASRFGTAWRDYWRMDSVVAGWYTPYHKSILESPLEILYSDGDYNSNAGITFTYDEQTVAIGLVNSVSYNRGGSLLWG